MTARNRIPQSNVRIKGAANKNECARHYVREMENLIANRSEDEAYADSARAATDQVWLQKLKDAAGIVENKDEKKKFINPIKAGKRRK